MSKTWIVDGYNFIRQSPRFSELEIRDGDQGRAAALRWLGRFGQRTGEKVWVVFDAYSGLHSQMQKERIHGLTVWASRGGYTADEEIIALAREMRDAAVVISSDRMIQEAAVKAGASILKSQEFEREVAKILEGPAFEDEAEERAARRPGRGQAFRPPKEKKKALALLKKYQ
ncbi:MAG TPA: NYN domain-containing protein [bacterium]|nr:NYN domain-containing protein [bacterium]